LNYRLSKTGVYNLLFLIKQIGMQRKAEQFDVGLSQQKWL
jgi:hypothetical protein